jgi:tetratricopeptide (TPR) repeat protein
MKINNKGLWARVLLPTVVVIALASLGLIGFTIYYKWANAESLRLLRQGSLLFHQGDLRSASEKFKKAVRLNSANGNAYDALGQCYYYSQQYDASVADYSKAIDLKPKDADIYFNRGLVYEAQNYFDRAILDFDKAIQLNKNDFKAFYERGKSQAEIGHFNEALSDFTSSIILNPLNAGAYYERARSYYQVRQYVKSILDCSAAIKLDPYHSEAYLGRAKCYMAEKAYVQALADCNAANLLKPNDVVILQQRANAFYQTGNWAGASNDWEQIVQQDQRNHDAMNSFAWLLATCEDPHYRNGAKAVDLAAIACSLTGWTNWSYVDTLATSYAETGKYGRAADLERESLKLAKETNVVDELQSRLKMFTGGTPYRVPEKR